MKTALSYHDFIVVVAAAAVVLLSSANADVAARQSTVDTPTFDSAVAKHAHNDTAEVLDVVIIGAGWSGLGAADHLVRIGNLTDLVVLEASNRTGGRTRSIPEFGDSATVGTFVVEQGSNWISGTDGGVAGVGLKEFPDVPKNPMAVLAERFGLKTKLIPGSTQNMSNYAAVFDSNGAPADASGDLRRRASYAYDVCLNRTASKASRRLSVREGLIECGWEPQSDVDWAVDWVLTVDNPGIVAELQEASEILPEETYWWWGNNDHFVIDQSSPRGWARLLDEMVKDTFPEGDSRIVFGAEVVNIEYARPGEEDCERSVINVTTADGRVFRTKQVISTLPLGVLKHSHHKLFSPPLSPRHVEVLSSSGIVMGNLTHVLLQFPSVWWDNSLPRWVSANSGSDTNQTLSGEFAEWQNLNHDDHIPGSQILLTFLGDPQSTLYEGMSDADAEAAVLSRLRMQHPNLEVPDPVAFFISRHGYDPLSRGAYSGFEPGWKDRFFKVLDRPLTCGNEIAAARLNDERKTRKGTPRVFFAGEAMCGALNGFTHGALQSGIEVAARLLHERGLGPDPRNVDEFSLCNW